MTSIPGVLPPGLRNVVNTRAHELAGQLFHSVRAELRALVLRRLDDGEEAGALIAWLLDQNFGARVQLTSHNNNARDAGAPARES